jgi:hypothetical protein
MTKKSSESLKEKRAAKHAKAKHASSTETLLNSRSAEAQKLSLGIPGALVQGERAQAAYSSGASPQDRSSATSADVR